MLASVRPTYVVYAEQRGEWYQRIVDAIDAELGGAYPERNVSWGLLVLDVLGLVAPFALIYSMTWAIIGIAHHQSRTRGTELVVFERAE